MTTMNGSISSDRISSARNNNLVAESDFQAALSALREKLHSSAPSSDPVVRRLLTDCSNSLERNIQRIVQPISDEAYHVYLSRYKDDIPFPSAEVIDTAATECTLTNVAEDMEEESFAEEDLLDQVAVARVQELRQQVRAQAARMVQLRNDTLRRAVSLTERQVQLWEKQQHTTAATSGEEKDAVAALLEQNKAALEDMKTSFSNLQQTLQETDSVLPSQLQLFQSTLQEIEHSLQNQQQKQLSQIEQAIFSRDDVHSFSAEDTPMEEEFRSLDPEQKLAHLLCHN